MSAWLTRCEGHRGPGARRCLGREDALDDGGQERRRRALACYVANGESEFAAGQVHVVEEVAADRAARQRRAHRFEETAHALRLGKQRALDVGRDAHLLLHLGLVERLAVQPRVLDGDRRLGGERFERGARGP